MIVYKITNLVNGKVYIGQTRGTKDYRWKKHVNAASNGGKSVLHKAIRKYGKEKFIIDTVATCKSEKELNSLECNFIESENSLVPSGYNLTTGGLAGIPSVESRKRMSVSHIGKKDSAQTKLRKKEASKGKKKTKEHAAHISEGRMGIKFSDAHIQNLRISHLGKKRSKEAKEKTSASLKIAWKVRKLKLRKGLNNGSNMQ